MINNISLAMVAGMGLRRLARVIHAYPTQGEAVRQAAQACVQSLSRMSPRPAAPKRARSAVRSTQVTQ